MTWKVLRVSGWVKMFYKWRETFANGRESFLEKRKVLQVNESFTSRWTAYKLMKSFTNLGKVFRVSQKVYKSNWNFTSESKSFTCSVRSLQMGEKVAREKKSCIIGVTRDIYKSALKLCKFNENIYKWYDKFYKLDVNYKSENEIWPEWWKVLQVLRKVLHGQNFLKMRWQVLLSLTEFKQIDLNIFTLVRESIKL